MKSKPTIVTIDTRTAGQFFGTYGIVRSARTGRTLASTRVYPYGFIASAAKGAAEIAAERGYVIR